MGGKSDSCIYLYLTHLPPKKRAAGNPKREPIKPVLKRENVAVVGGESFKERLRGIFLTFSQGF